MAVKRKDAVREERPTLRGKHRGSTITLSISEEDSKKVKVYALTHNTSVSQLLHEWIAELPE